MSADGSFLGTYGLVWAEPKTVATSNIFYLWKFIKVFFTVEPLHFYCNIRKPLIRDLVDVWVWNSTPNQIFSHRDPAIASSISFCCVLHKKSQRHQPTLPGAETIPLISSWFELSVGMVSAPGVVSWWHCVWWHNTMSDWLQKRLDCWGLVFPPTSTFCHRHGKKASSACMVLI